MNKTIKVFGALGIIVGLIIGSSGGFLTAIIAAIAVGWIGIGIPNFWSEFELEHENLSEAGCMGLLLYPITLVFFILYVAPKKSFDEWQLAKSKCLFAHKWNGCKCLRCGMEREHMWDGCKCARCGKVRDEQHTWKGCKCAHCDKVRDEQHTWKGCKCLQCGKELEHVWDGCKCTRCGMAIYEIYAEMSASEVQRFAKQGDKHALFEMAWRINEILPGEYNLVEQSAWNNIWFEKAAEAGHIDAKSRIAQNYYMMSYNGAAVKYRQKAVKYYQELSDDLDNGKLLDKEEQGYGETAKLWLGILLCMGYGLPLRDEKKGMEHIKIAENLTKNFKDHGFISLSALGKMYAQGYAQPDEDPSRDDLKKAIKYLSAALKPSKTQKVDKSEKEYMEKYLEIVKKNLETKVDIAIPDKEYEMLPSYNMSLAEFNKVRAKKQKEEWTKLSDAMKQQLKTYETALTRLRKRLERKGW